MLIAMECAKCSDQESLEYLFHMESNCRGLGRFHKGYRKFPSVVRGNSPWKLLWWSSMSVQNGEIKETVETKEGGPTIHVEPQSRILLKWLVKQSLQWLKWWDRTDGWKQHWGFGLKVGKMHNHATRLSSTSRLLTFNLTFALKQIGPLQVELEPSCLRLQSSWHVDPAGCQLTAWFLSCHSRQASSH